jgi:hypothetical protein
MMPTPDPSELLRLLIGEQVFGRDTDSKILQAANEVSARAMFELFRRCDTSRSGWAEAFGDGLMEITTGDPSVLIGFDDGRSQGLESDGANLPEDDSATASDFYLRLEFTDEDASYYQFHLFPPLDEPFIQGAARKREGACQHLMVTLAHPNDLQVFIQHLRSNPHLKEVHDSTAEVFNAAPSHAI